LGPLVQMSFTRQILFGLIVGVATVN
jgi:hypothetical protein